MKKYLNRTFWEPYVLSAAALVLPLYSLSWIINNFDFIHLLTIYLSALFLGTHISVFMHRVWCHKSWVPSKLFNLYGLLMCTLTLSGNTLGWVAIHREHHRYTDTAKDPHSPYHKSRLRVQFLTYLCEVKLKYVVDLARDKNHIFFAKYYWYINAIAWLILWLISPAALAFWFAMLGIITVKLNLVNTLLHKTPAFLLPQYTSPTSLATNSIILGLLFISGEPYHANHHDDPHNYDFSTHWYQLDFGAYLIRVAVLLGLGKLNTLS